jgi:hypothetical protein
MTHWSLADVEKAAPDSVSLGAARKLAVPGPWSETGSTETLVWGKCQGSGKTPYQVSVDLSGPAYRCSCPSRKFPCKHGLALLLLWVRSDGSVADAAEPAGFAADWAAERAARAPGTTRAARPAADPEARARRLQTRLATMGAGIEEFAQWLADLVRNGTATARRQPWAWWDATAARLVDAQLPGLADRVRAMSSEVSRRDDWADHLLAEAGRWWTAVQAWRRWDDLDDATRADLRTFLGWAWATDEVLARNEPGAGEPSGHWQVLGAHRSDSGRLQEQRTWLRAVETGELVQVLEFAAGGDPLPVAQVVGSVLDVPLARYPGSTPRRALFSGAPAPVAQREALPRGGTVDDALTSLADLWSRNPWAARAPVLVRGVLVPPTGKDPAVIVDADGASLPLLEADHWELLARTGGQPTDVFGELEEAGLRPLAVTEVGA